MKYNKPKLILFDLDGVFFTGGMNTFNQKLQKYLNFYIPLKDDHRVVLDEGLNLLSKDIIQVINEARIEQNLPKLTTDETSVVKELWLNNWKPDEIMVDVLQTLQGKCDLGVLSNADFLNGENYKSKGYFRYFSQNHLFLSYEMNCRKPDKEIFQQVVKRTGYTPEEITFVDNSPENVVAAKEFELNAVLYSNEEENSATKLQEYLLGLLKL